MAESVIEVLLVKSWPTLSGTLAVTTAFIALSEALRTPLTIATETSLAAVVLVADDQVGIGRGGAVEGGEVDAGCGGELGTVAGVVAHDGGVGGEVGAALQRNLE